MASTSDQVVLCEIIDRLLNKGAVIAGDITISVADVDLIYLGLMAVLTSVEKGEQIFGTTLRQERHDSESRI